ncbi:MAG: hypothetical protein ACRYHQ_03355 [Janthinobacterium lividum]
MSANLSDLGFVPTDQHPDAALFALIKEKQARNAAWKACKSERARAKVLKEWGGSYLKGDCQIAAYEPATMVGLIAKADEALQEWLDDDEDHRYVRMWATMASALERAMAILQAQQVIEMPAGTP